MLRPYLVLEIPGDDCFVFHSLWHNPNPSPTIEAELKQLKGKDYISEARVLLKKAGYRELSTQDVKISWD